MFCKHSQQNLEIKEIFTGLSQSLEKVIFTECVMLG
uniref:Uncharacterized protein n=1 Tax=Rhizophora mucronata TaxID=61149 RepID=A0A2P2PLE3_RHIMU